MSDQRYRAVLFDLDGTLVDSYAALTIAVNHARAGEGLNGLAPEQIRELVGEGVERLLQRALDSPSVPAAAMRAFEARYDEVCCAESRILGGVSATLQALHAHGIAMAVCTNKPTGFSRKILEFLELTPYLRAVVGPDAAGARKPDARHLLVTLESVGCAASETLFVGDMPIDVAAARNSEIDVAVIATGSATLAQLVEAQPDYVLQRFEDLESIVFSRSMEAVESQ